MIELHGTSASSGLARGRVHLLPVSQTRTTAYKPGTPQEESEKLRGAIGSASEELNNIIARIEKSAAAILEFQIELLGDYSFAAAAFDSIGAGKDAPQSWIAAMNREIADYRSGGDNYLSARADDIADLRDRVARHLLSEPSVMHRSKLDGQDIVLVTDQLAPSRFLELDLSGVRGIVTAKGSPVSHVAILARGRGIPMLVGCGDGLTAVREGEDMLLDADRGVLLGSASPAFTADFARKMEERAETLRRATEGMKLPAATADGESVRVLMNLDSPSLLQRSDLEAFDGVGLFRTEFLFREGAFPSEQEQYATYRHVLDCASGRPVTVRILDIGGDKPIKGLTIAGEENPFLGIRGIRLMRHRPDVFRAQMRALARAAVHGDLKVMAPMIAAPTEMAEFRSEMRKQVEALQRAGQECRMPSLGMMVEVPSAALLATEFDTDFYSIGTNDLIQYTYAAARDEHRLNYLIRNDILAVLQLIERVVAAGRTRKLETSVCGDMASTPAMVGPLLKAGIRCLSVAPDSLATVKQAVRQWPARAAGK